MGHGLPVTSSIDSEHDGLRPSVKVAVGVQHSRGRARHAPPAHVHRHR